MLRHCCDADGPETLTLEPLKPQEQCHRVRCLFANHFYITQGDMILVRTEIRCQSIESRQICFTINQGKYSARMTKAGVPFIGKSGPLLHTCAQDISLIVTYFCCVFATYPS